MEVDAVGREYFSSFLFTRLFFICYKNIYYVEEIRRKCNNRLLNKLKGLTYVDLKNRIHFFIFTQTQTFV